MSYNNLHNSWGHTQFNRLGQDEVLFAARMAMDPMMDLRYAMVFQDPKKGGRSMNSGYTTQAGLGVDIGVRNGLRVIMNPGSFVINQQEIGMSPNNLSDMDKYPVFTQGIGLYLEGGASITRTFQFDDPIGVFDGSYMWEEYELSVGAYGIGLSLTWDDNGVSEFFMGADIGLSFQFFGGGSAYYKSGYKWQR